MGEFHKEVALLPWRKGHFKFESGHHGDTWLADLEVVLRAAEAVEQLAAVYWPTACRSSARRWCAVRSSKGHSSR